MQVDLRRLRELAGAQVAIEVAVERLRQIAETTFAEALGALNIETLDQDPLRFHAATRALESVIDALNPEGTETDY